MKTPVLIQDFNPGGVTIGPDFCRRLVELCPNFRYAKLEEPMMASKVLAVREATEDRVGVLEGWGGLYMMDLIGVGICGVMPGLAWPTSCSRSGACEGGPRGRSLGDLREVASAYCLFPAKLRVVYPTGEGPSAPGAA